MGLSAQIHRRNNTALRPNVRGTLDQRLNQRTAKPDGRVVGVVEKVQSRVTNLSIHAVPPRRNLARCTGRYFAGS